jgi:solute carrier family 50 (sugar transporter)
MTQQGYQYLHHPDWNILVFHYVCPIMGVFISTALYMAPIRDLQQCLLKGSLGNLNPVPWAVMSGNCLGWLIYAHFAHDPFILASNIPGILVSVWLNVGASKLQYIQVMEKQQANETANENIVQEQEESSSTTVPTTTTPTTGRKQIPSLTPQDALWLQILFFWIVVVVCVVWLPLVHTILPGKKETIGLLVNINLLFFYGAPLQTIQVVFSSKSSDSLHTITVLLNCINAAFWAAYGIAVQDVVVYGPNGLGLLLGLLQALLCCVYPKSHSRSDDTGNNQISNFVEATMPLLEEN